MSQTTTIDATTTITPRLREPTEDLHYVAPTKLIKRYGVSLSGLAKWHTEGKVAALRTPSGHRRYAAEHVRELLGLPAAVPEPEATEKIKAIYCRVSSHGQREHLKHQVERMREAYPRHKVYSDIGSGINWKRKDFVALLERVLAGHVEEVVVAHRDRLCRIAYELVEHIFRRCGTRLLVHRPDDEDDDEAEPSNLAKEAARARQRDRGKPKRATEEDPNDDEEEEEDPTLFKTRKIRLRPTKEQARILNRWFGGARKVWNTTLRDCKTTEKEEEEEKKRSRVAWKLSRMQGVCVVKPRIIFDYLEDVPYSIKHEAVKQLHGNYLTCWTLKKQGHIRRFSIKYKRKKDHRTESIKILGHYVHWWKGFVYPDELHVNERWKEANETRKRTPRRRRLPNPHVKHIDPMFDPVAYALEGLELDDKGRLRRTCTLHKDKRQHFWLCVPIPIQHHERAPDNQGSIVALDPGVRTFLCGYSPTERTVREFGRNDFGRIWRLGKHADALQSKIDRSPPSRRKRKLRALLKLRKRVTNLVDDFHRKTALFLCRRYDHIIIPPFGVKGITATRGRRRRKIGKKTARMLYSWGHYRFRQWLLHKAREWGTKVYIRSEAWTSKTCTWCLHVTHEQKQHNRRERIFECGRRDCGIRLDRDINGARNILLRSLCCGVARWSHMGAC
ncbi:Transposase [Balamuthia mandrillaris]